MIGIDIETIHRFEAYVNEVEFVGMILSHDEVIEYEQQRYKARFLAVRFASKEALFKALKNQEGFTLTSITLTHNAHGMPYFKEYPKHCVSISHTESYVIAVVLNVEGL